MSDRGRDGLPFVARWRNEIRDSDLPRTTKLVAHTLSTYLSAQGATGPGTRETPTIVTLARGASLGRKTQKDNTAVKDALVRLELAGFLVVDRRRGQRGWTYAARIPRVDEGFESPAGTRDSAERIPRADVNESPAKTSGIPRRDGGEVEESESESDDDVVEIVREEKTEDLAEVLAPLMRFGSLTSVQRSDVELAWSERPEGVRALVDEALGPGVRSPIALFMSRVRDGSHRDIEVKPDQEWVPQAPLEPCEECGQEFGHAKSCSHATKGGRAGVCPVCGVAQEFGHATGFPCATEEEAA